MALSFDAALAEILNSEPQAATSATLATNRVNVAKVAGVAAPREEFPARAEAPEARSTCSTSSTGVAPEARDPDYLADRYEELAAILEHDEHMQRADAERAAFKIIHGGKA